MNELEYTYAVARIRALEASLLTDAFIDQLVNCQNEKQCLELLSERGWGDAETGLDAAAMLKREEEKTWEVIRDTAPDLSVFDVLSYTKVYHNLKAAIKEVCTEVQNENFPVFRERCRQRRRMLTIHCFIRETASCVMSLLTERRWRRFMKQDRTQRMRSSETTQSQPLRSQISKLQFVRRKQENRWSL